MAPNLIVCLTGMPGAGKSTIANGLKSQGFDVVVMGNAVRSEADKRNLEHNRENLASLMVTLRASDGPAAIAHLVEPEIKNATSNTVIVDGVRSDDEIAFFETICTTKILSVHASKDTRFNYMTNRGRSDDPQNKSKFTERDTNQISGNKHGPVDSNHDGYRRTGQTITICTAFSVLPFVCIICWRCPNKRLICVQLKIELVSLSHALYNTGATCSRGSR